MTVAGFWSWTNPQVIAKLREYEPELRAAGIASLSLFGSVARGDENPQSDVDLVAEFDRSRAFTLFELAGLEVRLADILDTSVDLADRRMLKEPVRVRVEREAVLWLAMLDLLAQCEPRENPHTYAKILFMFGGNLGTFRRNYYEAWRFLVRAIHSARERHDDLSPYPMPPEVRRFSPRGAAAEAAARAYPGQGSWHVINYSKDKAWLF
jgi:predicted nucleotidyltransferase